MTTHVSVSPSSSSQPLPLLPDPSPFLRDWGPPAPDVSSTRRTGLKMWEEGRLEEAIDLLTQAAKDVGASHYRLAELGTLLFAAGRLAEAQEKLCESLRANPQQSQAWITLACIFASTDCDSDAERAYHSALHLAPRSPQALLGLGLLYAKAYRFRPAARLLQAAIDAGENATAVHCCLAQAYLFLGDFKRARTGFAKAHEREPAHEWIARKHALLCLTEAATEVSPQQASSVYEEAAGQHAGDVEDALREAFHLLAGFGHRSPALRIGAFLLDRRPDDPVISYRLDALMGRPHSRAPEDYLVAAFEQYAPHFQRHMTDVLHYRLPEICSQLLAQNGGAFANVLDLGCGAGLAAPQLSARAETLIGLDISQAMLEMAAERGLYDRLICCEATAFLAETSLTFDLVAALDVLSYFGDLEAVTRAVAERLVSGGLFLFSHNSGIEAPYALQPSGRFSHADAYVDKITGEMFTAVSEIKTPVCLEANMPLAGRVRLLRRK